MGLELCTRAATRTACLMGKRAGIHPGPWRLGRGMCRVHVILVVSAPVPCGGRSGRSLRFCAPCSWRCRPCGVGHQPPGQLPAQAGQLDAGRGRRGRRGQAALPHMAAIGCKLPPSHMVSLPPPPTHCTPPGWGRRRPRPRPTTSSTMQANYANPASSS